MVNGARGEYVPLIRTDTTMLTNIQDTKILNSVIAPNTVDMVNLFAGQQSSAQVLLHYPSVLKHSFAVNRDSHVSIFTLQRRRYAPALCGRETRLRAKPLRAQSAWGHKKACPALLANNRSSGKVWRLPALASSVSFRTYGGKLDLCGTETRTEFSSAFSIGGNVKKFVTNAAQ